MNILITGGAGFIGSHLCDRLIAENHTLTVVDNLTLGTRDNIAHLMGHPRFTFIEDDLLHTEAMRELFENHPFDMVYHLAANSDIQKGGKDPQVDYQLTFNTTFQLLMMMKEYHVGKLFFASTSAIFGEAQGFFNEDFGPLMPVSNYGAGKLASEAFISAFSSTYGIQTWITRFPNVVGERFTHGVIFDFIRKLRHDPTTLEVLGNGEQCKPYIYVRDLVDGIQFVISHSHERMNVFHLGPESRTRVKEIAQMVIEEMGLDATVRYTGGDRGWVGDVPEFKYDLTRVKELGWQAPRTSNEAVRLAIRKGLGK